MSVRFLRLASLALERPSALCFCLDFFSAGVTPVSGGDRAVPARAPRAALEGLRLGGSALGQAHCRGQWWVGTPQRGAGSKTSADGVSRRPTRPPESRAQPRLCFCGRPRHAGLAERHVPAFSPESTPKPGTQRRAKGQACPRLSQRTFEGGGPGSWWRALSHHPEGNPAPRSGSRFLVECICRSPLLCKPVVDSLGSTSQVCGSWTASGGPMSRCPPAGVLRWLGEVRRRRPSPLLPSSPLPLLLKFLLFAANGNWHVRDVTRDT